MLWVANRDGPKIRLGTDFLKSRDFIFRLGSIELDINNPWKVRNPDAIDFAYNHPMGHKLRVLIKANRFRYNFQDDTQRKVLPRPDIPPKIKQD